MTRRSNARPPCGRTYTRRYVTKVCEDCGRPFDVVSNNGWKAKRCKACVPAHRSRVNVVAQRRRRAAIAAGTYVPGLGKTERVGLGIDDPAAPPSRPTEERPGSPAKIAVLAARCAVGEELWHPEDWV